MPSCSQHLIRLFFMSDAWGAVLLLLKAILHLQPGIGLWACAQVLTSSLWGSICLYLINKSETTYSISHNKRPYAVWSGSRLRKPGIVGPTNRRTKHEYSLHPIIQAKTTMSAQRDSRPNKTMNTRQFTLLAAILLLGNLVSQCSAALFSSYPSEVCNTARA